MKTVLTTDATEAAFFIKNGGLVAFPTETVYGLGTNVFDEKAVRKIFAAKGRPSDNPLIAHVFEPAQINRLVSQITDSAQKFIEAFFPAPLTIVLPKAETVPLMATAGLQTIGVRMPAHELAREFLKECNVPLVAPSANLSGRPSPTTWQAVFEDLHDRIDCILQGEQTRVGLESTVVDCTENAPVVLRAGAITLEELRKIVPATILAEKNSNLAARSPGTRYRHYSPRAQVLLIDSPDKIVEAQNAAYIGLSAPLPPARFVLQRICGDVEEYAHEVFDFFREADAKKIETVFCQTVSAEGLGAALMDRLRRAALTD